FTAFYGFLALYILGSLLFPQRFLPIGWLFGVIALLSILLLIKNRRNKSIFFLIIVSFVIFNIYNISPLYITDSTSAPFISTEADYFIARTLEFPNSYHYQPLQYYGHGGVVG